MSIAKKANKVSKEPSFVGPDEIPLLPKFITDQNPDQAGHYHLLLKEWWESVYENLNRLREMVVSYQVKELREDTNVNLTNAKNELSGFANTLVSDLDGQVTSAISSLDSTLSGQITSHINNSSNPHGVSPTQLGLHAVATSGDYDDLSDKPTLFSEDYNDLTNKPALFSGDYDDLTNKPTIPTVPGVATTSNDGLMSSGDKTKLDAVPTTGSNVPVSMTSVADAGNLTSIGITTGGGGYATFRITTTTGYVEFSANLGMSQF
jgi:hypothetical protein